MASTWAGHRNLFFIPWRHRRQFEYRKRFVFIRHFCALSLIWVIFSLVLVSCSVSHGRVVSPVPISHFIILSDHYLCDPANVTWPYPHLSSATKMKITSPSKTSLSTHQATWHHNSDDSHLSTHCHEDVKFYFSLCLCEIHNSCITFHELMYPFSCVWVWKQTGNIYLMFVVDIVSMFNGWTEITALLNHISTTGV